MNVNYPISKKEFSRMNTEELRQQFLMEDVFVADQVSLTYTHLDRMIFGGVMPTNLEVILDVSSEIGAKYFLEQREMGVVNIGGKGKIIVDNQEFLMNERDGLYIAKGSKDIKFISDSPMNPAKFYLNSAPAHIKYPATHIAFKDAKPMKAGSAETLNQRTIYKYIDPSVCKSAQLLMGMTILEKGSSWNTYPPHLHDRRMETYFYFDMSQETQVLHLVGAPEATKHLVIRNEQATISPSWSIHAGVGTGKYTFIWSMAGENQNYADLDPVDLKTIK